MELIDFRGLNCYYNCIVTIANARGLEYPRAFASLWSETDLMYQPYRRVYLTRRLLTDLSAAGAELAARLCDTDAEAAAALAVCDENELLVVGMDAFHIPWNPLCGLHHGPHFFIAANASDGPLTCWDPTYGTQEARIARDALTAHAFDISRLIEPPPVAVAADVPATAAAARRELPALREKLLTAVRACSAETRADTVLLAKYVDGLINNRRLFAYYLKTQTRVSGGLFADETYFSAWQAVKNGLYKLAVVFSPATAAEVCRLTDAVFNRETAYAAELIKFKQIQ